MAERQPKFKYNLPHNQQSGRVPYKLRHSFHFLQSFTEHNKLEQIALKHRD
ncbi:hypothetical protein DPMN_133053 [Dreissena polymorpha]|uniref:Uncharacterized protein n=1 Tax=Dreissena polymorpha TaxID=45954 RepID=A0A9D4FXS2_DREPO|nr:hypothetical protein DPMN_133053 [Dreissena polymorpha]